MKVLHINTHDASGGAAIAALRLHRALIDSGVDSHMLVWKKTLANDTTIHQIQNTLQRLTMKVQARIESKFIKIVKNSPEIYHTINFFPALTAEEINAHHADVVHLHWIGGSLLRVEEIAKIQAPIVWTLHDQWPLIGAEHHTIDGSISEAYRHDAHWIDRWMVRRKIQVYSKKKIHFVCPSRWMSAAYNKSPIAATATHCVIPNTIDSRTIAEMKKLSVERESGSALFIAADAERSKNKGYDLLKESLKYTKKLKKLYIVGKGNGDPRIEVFHGVTCCFMGFSSNLAQIGKMYRSVEITVVPSRVDNFPNTALESICMGTPVIGFASGGLLEIILPSDSDLMSSSFSSRNLATSIDAQLSIRIHSQSRISHFVLNFEWKKISKLYLNVYRNILKN